MNQMAKTKHFPKDPAKLFEDKQKPMSFDSMFAAMKAKMGKFQKKSAT